MKRRTFIKRLLGLIAAGGVLTTVPTRGRGQARRVLLQCSPLAGFRYYEGPSLWRSLGSGEPLTLRREPHNIHDRRAVAVYWRGHKLGYLPRRENRVVAGMLDRGERLEARITECGSGCDPGLVMFDVEVVV